MSIENPTLVHFRHFSSLLTNEYQESSYLRAYKAPLHLSRTLYKSHLFMQNKANFQKSQMNVNPYNITDYENKSNWTLGENKPNSKPIKPSLPEGKIDAKCVVTKDYEEKCG